MRIYDISQEIMSCAVYPGDPAPDHEILLNMEEGSPYNLSAFSMCTHNGTHVDAPLHFIWGGKPVHEMDLNRMIGVAYVAAHQGVVTDDDAHEILSKAKAAHAESSSRILIKGDAVVSMEAAQVFADAGILLLGNESQSVGPLDAPMAVHLCLLEREIVLLEGIRLAGVPEGAYLLCAAPLNIKGAEGAPCRAILIGLE